MNEILTSLLNRRTIRKYEDKPIEPEKLELLLQAGIRAPSAGNLQNYSLLVLKDKEKKAILAEETYSPFINDAPVCIISFVDYYRFKRLTEIFDAPFHFDSGDAIFTGEWDSLVALHSIAVAAESLGLGTCYIGLVLSRDNKKILGLPDYVYATGMITIGYPGNIPSKQRPRLPLETVVHFDEYTIPTDDELKDYYKEWLANWDNFYEKLSDEKKKVWNEEHGVYNNVQYITKTVYTKDRVDEWSKRVIENIRKAKFKFE